MDTKSRNSETLWTTRPRKLKISVRVRANASPYFKRKNNGKKQRSWHWTKLSSKTKSPHTWMQEQKGKKYLSRSIRQWRLRNTSDLATKAELEDDWLKIRWAQIFLSLIFFFLIFLPPSSTFLSRDFCAELLASSFWVCFDDWLKQCYVMWWLQMKLWRLNKLVGSGRMDFHNRILDLWWKKKLPLQWIRWVIYRTVLHQSC